MIKELLHMIKEDSIWFKHFLEIQP